MKSKLGTPTLYKMDTALEFTSCLYLEDAGCNLVLIYESADNIHIGIHPDGKFILNLPDGGHSDIVYESTILSELEEKLQKWAIAEGIIHDFEVKKLNLWYQKVGEKHAMWFNPEKEDRLFDISNKEIISPIVAEGWTETEMNEDFIGKLKNAIRLKQVSIFRGDVTLVDPTKN